MSALLRFSYNTLLLAPTRWSLRAYHVVSSLASCARAGSSESLGRVYTLSGYREGEHAALLAVSRRAPEVVFCLLTALRFHELTTQSPSEVWIAIPNKAHPPRMDYPPLRVMRFSDRSLQAGTITRQIDGATITVTGVEKTVADCFKFRNKIGLDIAIEALQKARSSREFDGDAFWRFANIDRVANVVRPYIEALA